MHRLSKKSDYEPQFKIINRIRLESSKKKITTQVYLKMPFIVGRTRKLLSTLRTSFSAIFPANKNNF